jgi:hypothetical protein
VGGKDEKVDFLRRQGIPYSETGVLASYAQVLRHLHTTGRSARNQLLTQPPQVKVRPLTGPRRRLLAARA